MARPRILAKKPLTEAILEVRWALETGPTPEVQRDPHYKFLLGTLFGTIKKEYPHHEELPAAAVPDEMTPHIVHHRFRVKPGGWPLLQVGPGVFTVNETTNYQWDAFERRINEAIPALVAAHPTPEALKFEMLLLRYINAIPTDFGKTNVLEFLSTRMKTALSLPDSVFADGTIARSPVQLSSEFVFPCKKPGGVLIFKFNTGRKEKEPALVFELWFMSRGAHVPPMPQGFKEWANAAHAVVETSFFHLIEGELEKEFGGDA
jgi:uncharacterized protein (TIGR04255 family)